MVFYEPGKTLSVVTKNQGNHTYYTKPAPLTAVYKLYYKKLL